MNRPGMRFFKGDAAGIVLFIMLTAMLSLLCTEVEAEQLGYSCGENVTHQDKWCIDPNQVVDIGASEVRTHGNGDPKSEYNGDLLYNYGTINVREGGLLKTNYTYYDNDKPKPGTNYLVVAQPLMVTNNGSLIVQKGGRVLNEGAVWNYGYIANWGTWDNWFALAQGGGMGKDKDVDNPSPRFDNYGLFNGMYKYSVIEIRRGIFNNYGVINTSGTIVVATENTGPDFYSNPPVNPTFFTNHTGAVINLYEDERAGGGYNRGGTVTNNGTITFHPGTSFTNDAGGKFINNNIVDNYGTFVNRNPQSLYWHQGGTIPVFVPGSYFENNGTWYNRAGSVFTTARMANVVNNGTFINDGRFEFTSGHYTGYGSYPGRPAVNGNKPSYFINRGLFRNNGEVILGSAIHGNEYTILPDGWSDMTYTKETGGGSMTNVGLITGGGSWSGLVINESGGTVAPGDSIGTMRITGNYQHNPGSTLEVELDPASSDQLIVTGTASLNGGRVNPIYSGIFSKNVPYTYTFLTAAGGVNGTFSQLVNNSAFFDASLSYFPTFVNLNLTRKGFVIVCETENQCEVADGIEAAYPVAAGDMRDIMNILLGMNGPQARDALDQMGGYIHTAIPAVTFSSFNQYRNMMTTRMAGFVSGGPSSMLAAKPVRLTSRSDTGNDALNTLLAAPTVAPGNTEERSPAWGFWTEGYGSLSERRASDVSSVYDYNTAGIVLGFDKKFTRSLLLGASAGYSYTKADLKHLSEDARISSYQGSLYGIYTKGPWYASGIAGYAYNTYDTTRDMAFGARQYSASASYNGHLLAGYIEGGYKWTTRYADIIPLASIQAVHLLRDSFSEDGAGSLSLDADRQNVASYLGSLGVRVRKDFTTKAGILSPEIRFRWDHEFSNDDHVLNASFTGYPQTAFTVRADKPDRDRLAAGVGLTLKTKGNVYLNLSYDGYFSNDTAQHSGMLGIQYKW